MFSGIQITQPNTGGGGTEILYGTIGTRPDPTTTASGTQFVATDIGLVYRSDGTQWFLIDTSDTPVENKSFTYNPDGSLNTVVGANRSLQYTYNPDGSLATVVNVTDGYTKNFTYNGDGSLAGVVIS